MRHVTSTTPSKTWTWTDGSETSWMNWNYYNSYPYYEAYDYYQCTHQSVSYGGLWLDVYCAQKMALVCEMESNGKWPNDNGKSIL